MGDPSGRLPLSQVTTNLQQTTDIAGKHSIRSDLKYILDLALAQALGHFRLGEIITARRSATDFAGLVGKTGLANGTGVVKLRDPPWCGDHVAPSHVIANPGAHQPLSIASIG